MDMVEGIVKMALGGMDDIQHLQVLQGRFATHRVLDVLVPDNGAQFILSCFEWFLMSKGIHNVLVAPFYQVSNCQARQKFWLTKEALARIGLGDWHDQVMEFSLIQHITSNAVIGQSPAELLMGCHLQSSLEQLHLNFSAVEPTDCAKPPQTFIRRDLVYAHNYAGDIVWVPVVVVGVFLPCSYQVTLEDRRLWHHYIDQLWCCIRI